MSRAIDLPAGLERATVLEVRPAACPGSEGLGGDGTDGECQLARARVTSGPDKGLVVRLEVSPGVSPLPTEAGDKIVVGKTQEDTGNPADAYYFADRQRGFPLAILAALFALVVIALGRWRGLTSLVGFAVSLGVITTFVLPAILSGSNPLLVSMVGSTVIMFLGLYLAHGINGRSTTALLGTFVSLLITAGLAVAFVNLAQLSGFTSEEAIFVNVSAGQINLRGLLLGGIIIGALGVLDDVTVTQASAVWELYGANPAQHPRQLYQAAIRIGRDHIASTVNTLILAYAGAALPLMVLFSLAESRLRDVITGEIVSEEIVRTLVGSIGLVASVPVTTALTAFAVTRGRPAGTVDPLVDVRPEPGEEGINR